MSCCRSSTAVEPSSRTKERSRPGGAPRMDSMMSSICVHCEKMSTLCPSSRSRGSSATSQLVELEVGVGGELLLDHRERRIGPEELHRLGRLGHLLHVCGGVVRPHEARVARCLAEVEEERFCRLVLGRAGRLGVAARAPALPACHEAAPALEQRGVQRALTRRHGHHSLLLRLWRQLLQHVTLGPAEHKGGEQPAGTPHLGRVFRAGSPGCEGGGQAGREGGRQHEGQEREELASVVLDRRARQQHALRRAQPGEPDISGRVGPLERVGLVQHAASPLLAVQPLAVDEVGLALALEIGVGGEDHVEASTVQLELHGVARRLGAVVLGHAERRAPRHHLAVPVAQHRGRGHHEVRPGLAGLLERGEQRDDLHRLAQPHFVGQDASQPELVHHPQPVQPDQLVTRQRARLRPQARRLLQQAIRQPPLPSGCANGSPPPTAKAVAVRHGSSAPACTQSSRFWICSLYRSQSRSACASAVFISDTGRGPVLASSSSSSPSLGSLASWSTSSTSLSGFSSCSTVTSSSSLIMICRRRSPIPEPAPPWFPPPPAGLLPSSRASFWSVSFEEAPARGPPRWTALCWDGFGCFFGRRLAPSPLSLSSADVSASSSDSESFLPPPFPIGRAGIALVLVLLLLLRLGLTPRVVLRAAAALLPTRLAPAPRRRRARPGTRRPGLAATASARSSVGGRHIPWPGSPAGRGAGVVARPMPELGEGAVAQHNGVGCPGRRGGSEVHRVACALSPELRVAGGMVKLREMFRLSPIAALPVLAHGLAPCARVERRCRSRRLPLLRQAQLRRALFIRRRLVCARCRCRRALARSRGIALLFIQVDHLPTRLQAGSTATAETSGCLICPGGCRCTVGLARQIKLLRCRALPLRLRPVRDG
eukprot:scaffold24105_cov113-Isochrysis_galbana.AAC.11